MDELSPPEGAVGAEDGPGIDWNGPTARFWVDHDDRYDLLLVRQGDALVAAASPGPGEAVLDIGCGCGSTTLRAAAAAVPGAALGVDISQAMIERARSRAADSGASNVRFDVADAQTADLGRGVFDLAISRFGVMFFGDPRCRVRQRPPCHAPGRAAGLRLLGGTGPQRALDVAFEALAPHLGPAPPPAGSSGPFAFADPMFVQTMLDAAGWVDIEINELLEPVCAGTDADDAATFELSDPETARDLAAADPAAAAAAVADLRAAFAARERPDGVWLSAAAWLVRAVAG